MLHSTAVGKQIQAAESGSDVCFWQHENLLHVEVVICAKSGHNLQHLLRDKLQQNVALTTQPSIKQHSQLSFN